MPGPLIPKPQLPGWADPAQASVFDYPGQGMLRKVVGLLGLDDPNQVMGVGAAVEAGPMSGGLIDAVAAKLPRFAKAIKAFHGSPHDYPAERLVQHADGRLEHVVGRPDVLPEIPSGATVVKDFPLGRQRMDKIGTGEGHQAFGHGLYEAEAEGTADAYRVGLSDHTLEIGGKKLAPVPGSVDAQALAWVQEALDRPDVANPLHFAKTSARAGLGKGAEADAVAAKIAEWQAAGAKPGRPGHMYELQINADPAHMLDWDKPLSQQSEQVRKVFDTPMMQDRLRHEHQFLGRAADPSGADLYKMLGHGESTAGWLNERGIPGIKYLDQGSRTAGEGSRNFVVFDDKLVDILKKYGLAAPAIGLLKHKAEQQGGQVSQTDIDTAAALRAGVAKL